jgi:type IV pilus assembly protein PilV
MCNQPTSTALRKQEAGITLIEVLVSLLIFSLGFLGLVGLQARAVQFSSGAENRSRAALLANEIVSTMWTQQSTSLSSSQIEAWQARLSDMAVSGLPNVQGIISPPDTDGTVTITIKWHAPSNKSTDQDSSYTTQVTIP